MAGIQADSEYGRHRRIIGWGIAGLLLLIGVVILVGALLRAVIGPTPGFGGFFFFPFGFIFFLFFLFFIFGWFRWWGWGWWGWRGYPMMWGYHDSAAEILRQRYARGEISKDQFDQMLRDIEQSRAFRP
jgi:putative membrane protein